jgi:hypothetical protein
MILKNYFFQKDNYDNYNELVLQYPDIVKEDDSNVGEYQHYNELQKYDYIQYLTSLDKVMAFYGHWPRFLVQGECWRTCYMFCVQTDYKRYKMCEGYYDGLPSLYHWVVKDTETGRLIDVHFDLIGTTIDSFTITNEMTIKQYDKITSKKKSKKN